MSLMTGGWSPTTTTTTTTTTLHPKPTLCQKPTLPPSTTQTLPNIAEDCEVKAITKIEEVELLHAPHVIDTFVEAAESSQNVGGVNSS
jgi:hypothetical protein